jgi:ABC exporter DevB family membrane fusion protein
VARANLSVVKAGAKIGEIEAQKAEVNRAQSEFRRKITVNEASVNTLGKQLQWEKIEQQATIQRLEAELKQAANDYRRYRILADEGAIALADLEQRGLNVATAKQRLQEAQARLMKTEATLEEQIQQQKAITQKDAETLYQQAKEAQANLFKVSEVRNVDVLKSSSELNLALAEFNQAKTDLETSLVKSPIDGQILKIYARPGEKVTDADGIADIGRTQQMMVVAEVYESDIRNIKPGQPALIKSENGSFPDELEGQVRVIGLKIGKKDVLGTDPSADIDARVVEVKILLRPESSKKVEGLTYAKVLVKILPD